MRYIILAIVLLQATIPYAQITPKQETQKFDEVLTYISNLYVDDVNKKELTEAAIVAMLEKLDPHSTKGIVITEIEKTDYWLKRLYAFGTFVD